MGQKSQNLFATLYIDYRAAVGNPAPAGHFEPVRQISRARRSLSKLSRWGPPPTGVGPIPISSKW